MIEYIYYLAAFGALTTVGQVYNSWTGQKPKKLPQAVHLTSPNAPNTSFVSDNDGKNVVHISNVVNNNATGSSSLEDTQQYLKKTLDGASLHNIASQISKYCYDNKYTITALTVASSYGYLFYKIHSIKGYIQSDQGWSAWKKDASFESLLAIPQSQLTHELIAAIQAHYINPLSPTDFLTPFINFSRDITHELDLLTRYHSYISWSMQFSLQAILPFSDALLSQLTERKQRVTYLKTLFNSWLAQYKLEQISRSRSTLREQAQLTALDKVLM